MSYVAQVHKTLADRVWEKVNRDGPAPAHCPHLGQCWVWVAYLDVKGYGRLSVATYPNGSYKAKLAYAHIIVWELVNGPILHNDCVLHRCDNPACVRPDHLFLGSRAVNNQDRWLKGRYNTNSKGEDNYRHKLTSEEVLKIRRDCIPGHPDFGYVPLGLKYGVSNGTIRHVYLRNNWKHI